MLQGLGNMWQGDSHSHYKRETLCPRVSGRQSLGYRMDGSCGGRSNLWRHKLDGETENLVRVRLRNTGRPQQPLLSPLGMTRAYQRVKYRRVKCLEWRRLLPRMGHKGADPRSVYHPGPGTQRSRPQIRISSEACVYPTTTTMGARLRDECHDADEGCY